MGDGDGYSSDEGASASVTSSRRSKTEQVNAEISVDNIVEGGRRKRAFESSVRPDYTSGIAHRLLNCLGTSTLRSATGTYHGVHLIDLAAASQWARSGCVSVCIP